MLTLIRDRIGVGVLAARLCRGAAACLFLTGCAPGSSSDDGNMLHDRTSVPTLIGEHIYGCTDGARLDADFLADGLTLDLATLPAGKPERLTAPATGLAFVGHKVNVSIAGAGEMTVSRTGLKPQSCRRVTSGASDRPRPFRL